MKKIILITGATSGFGKAIAEKFAENNFRIIITGRRSERLEEIKQNLTEKYKVDVLPLSFDVRDAQETEKSIDSIPDDWKHISILVNNAGLASGLDKLQNGDPDDWNKMIDTNIKGILNVSRVVIPQLIDQKQSQIVNIGSTAGKEVYEKGVVYCATKHAVDAISKGMRIDLLEHGVKVTQISPGAAETEFSEVRFHGDKERARKVYEGYQPMKAEDIAELVWYACNLPKNLCINDMVVTSLAQANSFYVKKS